MTARHNDYSDSVYASGVLGLIDACEKKIQDHMVTKVAELEVTVWLTPEPVPLSP